MISLIKSTFYNEKKTKQQLSKFLQTATILSFSKECMAFEKNFSSWQGRKHTLVVNSGSSANLAIIQSLLNLGRLKKGDAIGFSAVTWSTNAMPLLQLGLKPIPIDVELDTLNVSSKTVTQVIKKHRLQGLFLTNLLGFCADIDEIAQLCKKNKIILIEDNCESLGTIYKGKKLGNFGIASTFSFYVGHHMSTIEGGAICTDDEELATMLAVVRAHGWDRNLELSKQTSLRKQFKINSTFYSRYTFYDLGYNLRPTEICGFLGNTQLQYLPQIIQKRQKNFLTFAQKIYSQTDKYYPIHFDHLDTVSNFAVPVICKSTEVREKLVKKCNGKVEIRPIVGGNMTQQPFFKKYIATSYNLPNATYIHNNGLYFGNNPDLTAQEKQIITSLFS